jgi:hypothetical protein
MRRKEEVLPWFDDLSIERPSEIGIVGRELRELLVADIWRGDPRLGGLNHLSGRFFSRVLGPTARATNEHRRSEHYGNKSRDERSVPRHGAAVNCFAVCEDKERRSDRG